MMVVVAFFLFLGSFGHDAIGGKQQTCHRSGILESRTVNFRGREHTGIQQIAVLQGQSVEAKRTFAFSHFGHHHGAFFTGVFGQGPQRHHQSLTEQIDTELLVT